MHLNLLQIRLPPAGWLSILHRVSGVFLFLAIPWLIYLLDLSLGSGEDFVHATELLQSPLGSAVILVLMWALCHHLLAGIRYLLMDIDVGVDAPIYTNSAWAVLILSPALAVLLTAVVL
ncbi:MAG: succinate dehydrogenase, cytochrome b556 subunit [bacterium]